MTNLPNVRPGALSGTLQPFDAEPLTDEYSETMTQDDAGQGAVQPGEPITLTGDGTGESLPPIEDDGTGELLPPADLDAAIEWVGEPEDQDERVKRADAVFAAFSDPDNTAVLSARLQAAVYQTPQPQIAQPSGIEPTTQLGDVGAPNPDADGSGAPASTGEPSASSEAESSDDSTQSDPNTADAPPADDGQNSTSSSDDTDGN